jgi:dipeptidase D
MSTIKTLEPKAVWGYFDEITRVPRPSKHEEKIVAYLIEFAEKHRLEWRQDKVGNIVIRKEATPGRENAPTVILQSHVDMVAEKNSDVAFDFMRDPLQTYVEDGWVRARGTTLGADDGIGMAAALAVLTDRELVHGAVEALFTVDEETGLTGAYGLADNMLTGRYLINLDSEDEGEIFIGCAGGIDTVATFTYQAEKPENGTQAFILSLKGLKGGHSGSDIDKGHANSNKVLTRFLLRGAEEFGLRLSFFDGGNLRNAIPREAMAIFTVPAEKAGAMREYLDAFTREIKEEFKYTEPKVEFSLSETTAAHVVDRATQQGLLFALQGVANGVLAMSRSMPGLVETSTNLASVKFADNHQIIVVTSQRSSLESAKYDAMQTVSATLALGGATIAHSDGYPGWAPNPKSPLLHVAKEVYHKEFGKEAAVKAIHAGLECGLFLKKYPHLEMISIGPTLEGVHSPDERLKIDTVGRFWTLLTGILREL